METWEEIRMGLDALLRLLAAGLIIVAGVVVKALLPMARAALTEWLTTRAFARWTKVATGAAAEIADPDNPATSVTAKAAEMVKHLPDARDVLGAGQAAAERAIQRELSLLKLGGEGVAR